MNIGTVRDALLWCSLINYGMLVLWFLLFLLTRGRLYQFWGRVFHLSTEQLDAVNVAGMLLYKLGIFLFNLVPYLALRIVG